MEFDHAVLVDLSADESRSVKDLVAKGIKIPPQPRVLQELRSKLASGVGDVRVLARIIAQDPAIVAMLFKVGQSPVFRRYQPFASLEHILQTVGLTQTGNLVSAFALASALPAHQDLAAFEAYWARSQAISELAMMIAEDRVSVCNIFPDQACLAGIFHDCGVPVLMQRFPAYCQTMRRDEPALWSALGAEDERFGVDHCVIGYLVGKHWKLPDFICDAIRYHHDIQRIDDHAGRTMVAILQLAIEAYHQDERIANPEWASVRREVVDELGLSTDSVEDTIDLILDRYHETV